MWLRAGGAYSLVGLMTPPSDITPAFAGMQLQALIRRRQHRTPLARMERQQRHGKEKNVRAAVHAGVPNAPHGENAQATPQVTDATAHAARQLLHGKAHGKKRKARWENNQWYDNVRGKKGKARWENNQ